MMGALVAHSSAPLLQAPDLSCRDSPPPADAEVFERSKVRRIDALRPASGFAPATVFETPASS